MHKTPALLVCALLGGALLFAIRLGCPQHKRGLGRIAEISRAERWGTEEFAALVRARVPGLEAVRKAGAQPVSFLYLTRGRWTWDVAQSRLTRQEESLSRWQGTVFLEKYSPYLDLDQWGDNLFLRVDPFLLFGDPELVCEIRDALSR